MKIAIIGAGNMGGATALGFARFVPEAELIVTAAHAATLGKFAVRGIATTLDNVEAVKDADIVILGVKPWLVDEVLTQIKGVLQGKILVSMAAGIPLAQIEEWLEGSGVTAAYAVIPNLAIEIGESMTFITEILGDPAAELQVLPLFNKVGKTLIVSERQLDAGMMVASCGTAFALRYARAAMEGGIQLGLYPREALEAVLQTIKVAADLVTAHGTHPEQEIDRVTTPGGITIKGLNAMEAGGFTASVIDGLLSNSQSLL